MQKNILTDAIELIKDEGLLIYSTCTFAEEENELNLAWLYKNFGDRLTPVFLPVLSEWGVTEIEIPDTSNQKGYYCFPHKTKGEGMFIAAMWVSGGRTNIKQTPVKHISKKYMEDVNTPYFCSPSSESFWSQ